MLRFLLQCYVSSVTSRLGEWGQAAETESTLALQKVDTLIYPNPHLST
jgi:hypothetical protein